MNVYICIYIYGDRYIAIYKHIWDTRVQSQVETYQRL